MNISGYTSILAKNKNINLEVGDVAISILSGFSQTSVLSAYQIYSSMKTAYKNVHKRVQRLESLGLIELATSDAASHGAKYYKLTEGGMYKLYLSSDVKMRFVLSLSEIIKHHGNLEIFKTFLYPYFEKTTLIAMDRPRLSTNVENIKTFKVFFDELRTFTSSPRSHDVVSTFGKTMSQYLWGPNIRILFLLHQYLQKCCRHVQSILKEPARGYIASDVRGIAEELILQLIFSFGEAEEKYAPSSIQNPLTNDNKFMENAEDVFKRFERSYRIAANLRGAA
jgi:hypothetical protein